MGVTSDVGQRQTFLDNILTQDVGPSRSTNQLNPHRMLLSGLDPGTTPPPPSLLLLPLPSPSVDQIDPCPRSITPAFFGAATSSAGTRRSWVLAGQQTNSTLTVCCLPDWTSVQPLLLPHPPPSSPLALRRLGRPVSTFDKSNVLRRLRKVASRDASYVLLNAHSKDPVVEKEVLERLERAQKTLTGRRALGALGGVDPTDKRLKVTVATTMSLFPGVGRSSRGCRKARGIAPLCSRMPLTSRCQRRGSS